MKSRRKKWFGIAGSVFFVGFLVAPLRAAVAPPTPDPNTSLGWSIPGVELTAPKEGQKIQLKTDMWVSISGPIPDWFVQYAKASPFRETWSIQVSGPGGFEVISKDVDKPIFGFSAGQGFFQKRGGAGKYTVKAWLNQWGLEGKGYLSGPSAQVAFEVVEGPLPQSKIPGVKLTVPKHGQKFQTQVKISGQIPDWFAEFAKESLFQKKWHIEVRKVQKVGPYGLPGEVFSGDVVATNFGADLSPGWFMKHGGLGGQYTVKAWVSQAGSSGPVHGPIAFEVIGPSSEKGPPPIVKPMPQLLQLPDISSGAEVAIAGKLVPWGTSVAVDVKQARSINKNNSGLCEFFLRHWVTNIGNATTDPFDSAWTNSAVPGSFGRSWLPISPSLKLTDDALLSLKPGQNILRLTLDNLNKVKESNEQNNQFQIVVNVSGNCGPASTPLQRAVSPTLPPVVPQAPGDQRQPQAPPAPVQRRLNPPGR